MLGSSLDGPGGNQALNLLHTEKVRVIDAESGSFHLSVGIGT